MNANAVNDNNTPTIEYKEPTNPLPVGEQMPSDSRPFPIEDTPPPRRYNTVSGFPPVGRPSFPPPRSSYKGRGH